MLVTSDVNYSGVKYLAALQNEELLLLAETSSSSSQKEAEHEQVLSRFESVYLRGDAATE